MMFAGPELCFGRVMHKRLRPVGHLISYPVFFLRVPLSKLGQLNQRWFRKERFGLLGYVTRDYGPRDGSDPEAWVRRTVAEHGVDCADGEIVLQTFPRVLGFVFNPISVWYCYDKQGQLRCALAEVNNTFGERHNYVVAHHDMRPIQPGDYLAARKIFHVSPFCEIKGDYRFRFEQTDTFSKLQIDYHDSASDDDKLIVATMHGHPEPLTDASALKAFRQHAFMTFLVVIRIHWHALKLYFKNIPFHHKPEPPTLETTRARGAPHVEQ